MASESITYWALIKCNWIKVTTSRAIWKALPHVNGCGVCCKVAEILPALPLLIPAVIPPIPPIFPLGSAPLYDQPPYYPGSVQSGYGPGYPNGAGYAPVMPFGGYSYVTGPSDVGIIKDISNGSLLTSYSSISNGIDNSNITQTNNVPEPSAVFIFVGAMLLLFLMKIFVIKSSKI